EREEDWWRERPAAGRSPRRRPFHTAAGEEILCCSRGRARARSGASIRSSSRTWARAHFPGGRESSDPRRPAAAAPRPRPPPLEERERERETATATTLAAAGIEDPARWRQGARELEREREAGTAGVGWSSAAGIAAASSAQAHWPRRPRARRRVHRPPPVPLRIELLHLPTLRRASAGRRVRPPGRGPSPSRSKPAHLPSAGDDGAAGAVGAPPATSAHELPQCPVCTCSVFSPIHQNWVDGMGSGIITGVQDCTAGTMTMLSTRAQIRLVCAMTSRQVLSILTFRISLAFSSCKLPSRWCIYLLRVAEYFLRM
ncbi:unnamed protein product, partial [Urochloa humidicola]